MRWLSWILVFCVLVGAMQWLHAHPDASVTSQMTVFFHEVHEEWSSFIGAFADYWDHFPHYMRNLFDNSPGR